VAIHRVMRRQRRGGAIGAGLIAAASVHTTALVLLSLVAVAPRRVVSEGEDGPTLVTMDAILPAAEPAPLLPAALPAAEPARAAAASRVAPRKHRLAGRLLVAMAPRWGDSGPPVVEAAGRDQSSEPPPRVAPPAGPPSLPRATYVAATVARALRAYDTYPSMGDAILDRLRRTTSVAGSTAALLDICVSPDGAVRDVSITGPSDAFNRRLRAAVLTWRYRPLLVGGAAAPFCHLMKVDYSPG
jgi:hypothetical protein